MPFPSSRTRARRVGILSAAAVLGGCALAAPASRMPANDSDTPVLLPPDSPLQPVRARLQRLTAADTLPSVAVAVMDEGRVIWREAFGWADREGRVGAGTNTVYGLGSLGKALTATAVLSLVERGEVALDAPVNGYLRQKIGRAHV